MDKIAEIKERFERRLLDEEEIKFILDELERKEKERAEFSSMYFRIREEQIIERGEIQKLREERDSHGPEGRNYTNLQYVTLLNKFQSAQQEIKNLINDRDNIADSANHRNNVAMHEREQKLIEGIRKIADSDDEWYVGLLPMQTFALNLLQEIGATP